MSEPISISKSAISIGLEKPIKILHITDSHLNCIDGYENNRAADFFVQAVEYAKQNDLILVHTGDLMDFISDANLALLNKNLAGVKHIYAIGNHDFCKAPNDDNYEIKKTKAENTIPYSETTRFFDSKVISGINFITISDFEYQISAHQVELIKAEAAKEYPIILVMHIPIFTKTHAEAALAKGLPCAFQVCAADEYLSKYSEDQRILQTPDEETTEAVQYIKNEPLIKAIISGHTHVHIEEEIANGLLQITTGAGCLGYAREITIV